MLASEGSTRAWRGGQTFLLTIILIAALLTPTVARAAKLTCLTGTDPSVANDAWQLARAREVIEFFGGCGCQTLSAADFVRCQKKNIDTVINAGSVRRQCRNTLIKEFKQTACASTDPSALPCVKKTLGGKVTCAIKPRAQCSDAPGRYTQVACSSFFLFCAESADTNNDGLIGAGDSGACAATSVCGNGVREDSEQCDPPGASCPTGQLCGASCSCVTPTPPPGATNTPTRTPVPGAPTSTPTRTAVPGAPTNTPTPSSIGCCMNATVVNVTGCLDSSANGFNAVFCGQSQGVWINDDHCTCQSSGPCPGSCVPGTPAPRLTATRTPTRTFTPAPPTFTFTPVPRFADNGNGTITDNQTGLIWEKKDQAGGLDDMHFGYAWAGTCSDFSDYCQPDAGAASACSAATGGARGCALCGGTATCNTYGGFPTIWHWLNQLNVAGLGGHSDWRIPSVGEDGGAAELETILAFPCPVGGQPCVPAAFNTGCTPGCNATGCSCTVADVYWSATTSAFSPSFVWIVYFNSGLDFDVGKNSTVYGVRAVRGP
jgi:hypothetical protein